MKTLSFALAASAAALISLAASSAHALGPIDLEIAGKGGYGSHDLGPGFGGRAGVSFFGIYGGLSIIDYLGVSPGAGEPTPHLLAYGGEVGFGFKISHLTIRPLLGFGDATQSESVGSQSLSSSAFYLEPGGLIQLKFGLLIFGVDASCFIVPSINTSSGPTSSGSSAFEAFTIHGQVGVSF
jgi:hypothetical protein